MVKSTIRKITDIIERLQNLECNIAYDSFENAGHRVLHFHLLNTELFPENMALVPDHTKSQSHLDPRCGRWLQMTISQEQS